MTISEVFCPEFINIILKENLRMSGLIFGSMIGALAGLIHGAAQTQKYLSAGHLFLRPFRKGKRKGFLRRVQALFLRKNIWWMDFILFFPLVPIFLFPFLLGKVLLAIGMAQGYLLVVGGGRALRVLNHDGTRERLVLLGKERLLKYGTPAEATTVFGKALIGGDYFSQEAAIEALSWLGTVAARKQILAVAADPNSELQKLAIEAVESLDKALLGKGVLSTQNMRIFLDELAYQDKEIASGPKSERADLMEKRMELEIIVDEIVFSQIGLRNQYPDLFCTACNAKVEMVEKNRWKYVQCRICQDVHHLETGMQKVVGRIGNFPRKEMKDGVLYLNLWDESEQKAVFADIHRMDIVGGAMINYDWAVNAVVECLNNYGLPNDYPISVVLKGELTLDDNSRKILREIGYDG